MSAPNDLKLINAHDALSAACDLVEGIYLAGSGISCANESSAIIQMAALALTRMEKAKRKIDRYREKDAAAKICHRRTGHHMTRALCFGARWVLATALLEVSAGVAGLARRMAPRPEPADG